MTTTKHTASSQRWIDRQNRDHFVKKAKQTGYRSRSAYKLLEIQKRDQIFRPGFCVIDLGAAPGGWSQVAIECLKQSGRVIALDRALMQPLNGVDILEVDFEDEQGFNRLIEQLGGQKVNVILSDMVLCAC